MKFRCGFIIMLNYNNYNLFCFAVCSFKGLTFKLKMVERMSKNINVLLYGDLLIYVLESLPNNQIFANELVCKWQRCIRKLLAGKIRKIYFDFCSSLYFARKNTLNCCLYSCQFNNKLIVLFKTI